MHVCICRYAFTEANFRGQVNSRGQVCGLLEKPLNAGMALLMSGQIDHSTGDSKFGIGLVLQM